MKDQTQIKGEVCGLLDMSDVFLRVGTRRGIRGIA